MFCKNCGAQLNENAAFCVTCGAAVGQGNTHCGNCGNEVAPGAAICLKCGAALGNNFYQQNGYTANAVPNGAAGAPKSKIAAGLLGIFLGAFGVHNFMLGYTSKAVAQLLMSSLSILLTIFSCGILGFTLIAAIGAGIWGLVEGILILTGSGNYTTDAHGVPLQ